MIFRVQIEIVSFDLCPSRSCDVGEKFIHKLFPGVKLRLIRGDSRITVPKFQRENPDIKCDFISIDGGHTGDIPKKDLHNMKLLAAKDHTVVIDDVNSQSRLNFIRTPGKAWENAVSNHLICPIDVCKRAFGKPADQAQSELKFCMGTYCDTI